MRPCSEYTVHFYMEPEVFSAVLGFCGLGAFAQCSKITDVLGVRGLIADRAVSCMASAQGRWKGAFATVHTGHLRTRAASLAVG